MVQNMTTLVIVESPAKAKKISEFLGAAYIVRASVGHVRDLPEREMGVDLTTFSPKYVLTERGVKVVSELKRLATTCSDVILATDLDREGEAIAWHLQQELKLSSYSRIVFDEITKSAIEAAMAAPRQINLPVVNSQQGRRVLDRLVGYMVSPVLNKYATVKLSAGRVQSIALMLVVNREKEIMSFRPVPHYKLMAHFKNDDINWTATWNFIDWAKKANYELNYEDDLDDSDSSKTKKTPLWMNGEKIFQIEKDIRANPAFTVLSSEGKETSVPAKPPLVTSTMQQAAFNALGFPVSKTMALAQELYANGYITYHRTDKPNLSEFATNEIRNWIGQWTSSKSLPNLIPAKPNHWDSAGGSQEAHEAIRPTHIEDVSPNISLSDPNMNADGLKLYKLIWLRAVASQMLPAKFLSTRVMLETVATTDGIPHVFIANGSMLIAAGWKHLLAHDGEDEAKDKDQLLPQLAVGQIHLADSLEVANKKTSPPKRFTEASLVKELEKREIGRPSTYATIITTLKKREYVKDDKRLFATPLGIELNDRMAGYFSFMVESYTKEIESKLDLVLSGKETYQELVSREYLTLNQELNVFDAKQEAFKNGGKIYSCVACGKPLRKIELKNKNKFWGCTGYPACEMSLPDMGGRPARMRAMVACPECAAKGETHYLGLHLSMKKTLYWKCPHKPCSASYPDKDAAPDLQAKIGPKTSDFPCPICKQENREGFLVPLSKDNRKFWGCTTRECKTYFPDKNDTPDLDYKPKPQVSDYLCPNCEKKGQINYLLSRVNKHGQTFWACGQFSCKTTFEDLNGAPNLKPPKSDFACPICKSNGVESYLMLKDSGGKEYFTCSNRGCYVRISAIDHKPDNLFLQNLTKFAESGTTYTCAKCKKGILKLQLGLKGAFWGCSNYPGCKFTCDDKNGKPDKN